MNDKTFMAWPSRILFGCGELLSLAPLLQKQRFRQALIVTDKFFTDQSDIVVRLMESLASHGIGSVIFDEGEPDPSVALCQRAAERLSRVSALADIDHVIAVGGGSNIDLAKVLSVTLKYGGHPADYVGEGKIPGKPLALVAVPTTSGAGSEITPGAILVQENSSTKVALMDNDLRPVTVVVDPLLTVSCPPKVTADAGIDALTHAIESYLTCDSMHFDRQGLADPGYSGRNHITQLMAAESIRLCFAHLPTAYRQGADVDARIGMAYGSLLAAFSYANAGLNAVHALAYALAGLTHASHGSTNAVFLPYVMQSLLPVRERELAHIGSLAGLTAASQSELARKAVIATRDLVAQVGIPVTLKDFGVTKGDLAGLASNGLAVTRLVKAFPIQPPRQAFEAIVANAYAGKILTD
ncbi:iron-containing alcohol dehydrogenase [Noviherbaspirillum sp. Root189]|uniref:iron-containing alcohol dehydrogenase n=1 Tax=Noviherbaspirillum sp. Root189 TaxID=1736487 RepID=UPI00070DD5DF|nr:iron-containing alcohol dehydrogenase [Noviherbaspirillum sp. Root189]KRB93556.1 alcohol dehydrogenase [Noviherbaspirillum sp. Root189]